MGDGQTQRRRFPRIASTNTVLVKRIGEHVLEEFARTRTMGLGGCSFLSDESLGEGSPLELLISVDREVVKARARIIYEQLAEEGRYEIGAEFIDLDPGDRDIITSLFETADTEG